MQDPEPSLSPTPTSPFCPKSQPEWERQLLPKFIIAATEGKTNSLKLMVELETTDTAEIKSTSALVDCGATREFIDWYYAKSFWFCLLKLSKPIPVFNIDSTPNEGGSVMKVVDLLLQYKNHSEHTLFAVSNLGKQKLILRHSWLHKHNPEINWETREVKMPYCLPHCCTGCQEDAQQEQIAHKAQICRKEACSSGPVPELHHDADDYNDSDDEAECLDQSDQIFTSSLLPPHPSKDICALSTISTYLTEAFKANLEANAPPIPDYLKKFLDVFSKKSFNTLSEHKQWDHAIKLVPGEKPASCNVYPLAPSEQKELDTFLKENLETGQIHLSKSLISSPVSFIKKKDGLLCLVQDYQALNTITAKNKYLLLLNLSQSINSGVLNISLSSMSDGVSIMFRWKKGMSGRLSSIPIMDFSNL